MAAAEEEEEAAALVDVLAVARDEDGGDERLRGLVDVAVLHPNSAKGTWDHGSVVSVDAGPGRGAVLRVVLDESVAEGELGVHPVLAPWLCGPARLRAWRADRCRPIRRLWLAARELGSLAPVRREDLDASLQHVDLGAAAARRLRGTPVPPGAVFVVRVLGRALALVVEGGDGSEEEGVGSVGPGTDVRVTLADRAAATVPTTQGPVGLEDAFEEATRVVEARTGSVSARRLAPHAVVVLGPHGSGKSVLLDRLCSSWETRAGVCTRRVDCGRLVLEAESGETSLPSTGAAEDARRGLVLAVDGLDALLVAGAAQREGSGGGGSSGVQGAAAKRVLNWLCAALRQAACPSSGTVILATCTEDAFEQLPRRLTDRSAAEGFPQRIQVPLPDKEQRARVLEAFVGELGPAPLSAQTATALAACSPGFSRADLWQLAHEARDPAGASPAALAARVRPLHLEILEVAAPPPREGKDASWPWTGVGGYLEAKKRIERLFHWNALRPELAQRGIILHGPPGCGKTLFADAIARGAQQNFISVKASDLLSMYLGESERLLRQLFTRAQRAAPCVVFLDEVDAIAAKRDLEGGSDATSALANRVLATLLNEMDGIGKRQGVTFLAATNRLSSVDPALLRPGRLGAAVELALPGPEERLAVLRTATASTPLSDDVDLARLADLAEGRSCAQLAALCAEAGMAALRERLEAQGPTSDKDLEVGRRHFQLLLLKH